MRISRTYTVDDWKALTLTTEADWLRAVAIFKDRLETRYLEHIRELLPRQTSGFVVLALDCALIETLEQFKHGGSSEGAPGLRPDYHEHYYGAYFRDPDGNKLCVACHLPHR